MIELPIHDKSGKQVRLEICTKKLRSIIQSLLSGRTVVANRFRAAVSTDWKEVAKVTAEDEFEE